MTLKQNQATPVEKTVTAIPQDGTKARDDEVTWVTFPKEFERSLTEIVDKRFAIIWALTITVELGSIAYLVSTAPSEMSAEELARRQKKFAALVLQKGNLERETKLVETPLFKELPAETPVSRRISSDGRVAVSGSRGGGGPASSGGAPGSGGSVGEGGGGYGIPISQGRRTREEISNAASRAGILGLLTSNSGLASGDAAEDVLNGNNASMANLDEALSKAGGLRRGSAAELGKTMGPGGDVAGTGKGTGREVRGGRGSNAGGIDALVQGLGEGRTQGVQRSGGLEVGNGEPLIEETEEGKATGTRDRDAVAAVVAKHIAAIQFCYQRELKRSPNLKGKMVVRFVITPQGTVESVKVLASTLGNSDVESCIVERIKRWNDFGAIDPSKGNTTFRQVYTFGY